MSSRPRAPEPQGGGTAASGVPAICGAPCVPFGAHPEQQRVTRKPWDGDPRAAYCFTTRTRGW